MGGKRCSEVEGYQGLECSRPWTVEYGPSNHIESTIAFLDRDCRQCNTFSIADFDTFLKLSYLSKSCICKVPDR